MPTPKLKFSPLAWLHYEFLCHAGPTEVGAFGVHAPGDPFTIEWLWVPKQECNSCFVQADKEAWEDFLLDPDRIEFHKSQPVRPVWLHTHPGNSARPSSFDEKNWREEYAGRASPLTVFGILARGGDTYGRTHVHAAGEMAVELEFEVLWDRLPADLDVIREASAGWAADYATKVAEKKYEPPARLGHVLGWGGGELGDQFWERAFGPAAQQDEKPPRGSALMEVLADEGAADADPTFEDWLKEYYDVSPGQLDHDNLQAAKEEYLEYYPDEPLCEECSYPLDEEERAAGRVCVGCYREEDAWRRWQAQQDEIDDLIDAVDAMEDRYGE